MSLVTPLKWQGPKQPWPAGYTEEVEKGNRTKSGSRGIKRENQKGTSRDNDHCWTMPTVPGRNARDARPANLETRSPFPTEKKGGGF